MRQVVTGLLVLLTIAIGAPMAGADPSTAALIGQVVDAGGRGAVGRSVELVRDGAVVSTAVTAASGEFRFAGIAPGSYVVRTMVNNQAAGTRISVNAGESIPVTVVLPSLATASPQVGALFGVFTSSIMSGTMAITNSVFTNSKKLEDLEFISDIPLLTVQNFLNQFQNSFNADQLARLIHVGPYSTF